MNITRVFSFVVVVGVCAVPAFAAAPRGDAKALRGAADRSVVREKFCDAAYLYRKLDEMEQTPETLIAASDAASQGGDRGGAVRFLETFQSRYATHRLASTVASKLEALRGAVSKYGAGATCADPAAECGNGAFEAGEDCDDGNRVDADSCPATCKIAGSVVTPPPPPPVVTPPVKVKTPPPPPPPPPVKIEPPPPVKVEPPPVKVEPKVETTTSTVDDEDPAPVADDGSEGPVREEPQVTPPPPPPKEEPKLVDDRRGGDEEEVPAVDDEAEVEPAGGGAPVGGIILSILGGVAVVGGGGAAAYASIPLVRFVQNVPQQTTVQQTYLDAQGSADKRAAARAAADLRAALVADANSWNSLYRWVATGGGVAAAAGVGMLIGGIVIIASGGGDDTATEDDAEADADKEADTADEEAEESDRNGSRR